MNASGCLAIAAWAACWAGAAGTMAIASAESAGEQRQAAETGAAAVPAALRTVWTLPPLPRVRRGLVGGDVVEAAVIRGRTDIFPPQTRSLDLPGQPPLEWRPAELDEQGRLGPSAPRAAYVYAPIRSPRREVLMLEVSGHGAALFNGEPRGADPYGYGYVRLPVLLRPGVNHLLVRPAYRRPLHIRLSPPPGPVYLSGEDATSPDLVAGEPTAAWAAVVVVNATPETVDGLRLAVAGPMLRRVVVAAPPIPPLAVRKVPVRLEGPAPPLAGPGRQQQREGEGAGEADQQTEAVVQLLGPDGPDAISRLVLPLRIRSGDQARKRTFLSRIDGSVQYYALRPATPRRASGQRPALVLSCHGAAVKAIRQASAYSPKSWLHLVAPTNRRPYGFDWEDFGREDAMEVLQLAKQQLPHDPSRIYVTGHSMGGHGAWHLAVTYPDQFAAVGPSAGWLSYQSYGRRSQAADDASDPLRELLRRGAKAGDTVGLARNLLGLGVYILHGAEDDNVPAAHARRMAEVLAGFHHDWVYHEEPGKRHWWSNEDNDGGATCMDWPPMYDLFARHARPPAEAIRVVEFTTANPGVSSRRHWAAIVGQQRQHAYSRVRIRVWPNKRRYEGETENVAVLRLDTTPLRTAGPITVVLDGETLAELAFPEEEEALWLERSEQGWRRIPRPPTAHKGPHRYGAVKEELRRRFLFVYGTQGSEEEKAAIYAKARFDAETFWYRGNGAVDILPDAAFDPQRFPDRTVVLYGDADTNAAWPELLAESPLQVGRGRASLGDQRFRGDDLAAIQIRPRPDSDTASVIAVSGTGPTGYRLGAAFSFFVPFVRYPDVLILRAAAEGEGQPKVLGAGYFGLDWSLERGEFAWASTAPMTSARSPVPD